MLSYSVRRPTALQTVRSPLQLFDIVKPLGSKTDGPATVRSPLQLLNIVKLHGSKTDGPATVRSLLQLFNIVKLHSSKTDDPATVRCEGSRLRYPVRRPTARLLLLLPFHIGPATTNPLCESTLNLLSQLPYHIVDAVSDLLLLPLVL